jgi:hypothetical protein
VKRKYDEFYVLDSRLKEFHGILDKSDAHLPPKQRNLFGNSRNIDYLRSIKSDFERYIQVEFLFEFVFLIFRVILSKCRAC